MEKSSKGTFWEKYNENKSKNKNKMSESTSEESNLRLSKQQIMRVFILPC